MAYLRYVFGHGQLPRVTLGVSPQLAAVIDERAVRDREIGAAGIDRDIGHGGIIHESARGYPVAARGDGDGGKPRRLERARLYARHRRGDRERARLGSGAEAQAVGRAGGEPVEHTVYHGEIRARGSDREAFQRGAAEEREGSPVRHGRGDGYVGQRVEIDEIVMTAARDALLEHYRGYVVSVGVPRHEGVVEPARIHRARAAEGERLRRGIVAPGDVIARVAVLVIVNIAVVPRPCVAPARRVGISVEHYGIGEHRVIEARRVAEEPHAVDARLMEGAVAYRNERGGEGQVIERGAHAERLAAYGLKALLHAHPHERGAFQEGVAAYAAHACGKEDLRDRGAVCEGVIANRGHALADRERNDR